jgi:Uma2 family endonuclease
VVQISYKPITLVEFLKLPETKPAAEYIGGRIGQKPTPQGQHSIIQGELLVIINLVLKKSGIAIPLPELRCTFGDRSIVPDIAVFKNSRIPRTESGDIANSFTAAPDWTIEILSPEQSATKVLNNITHCLKHGSEMGWLIDPEERSILVCQSGRELTVIEEPNAIIPVPDFASAIQLTLNNMFDWLR